MMGVDDSPGFQICSDFLSRMIDLAHRLDTNHLVALVWMAMGMAPAAWLGLRDLILFNRDYVWYQLGGVIPPTTDMLVMESCSISPQVNF